MMSDVVSNIMKLGGFLNCLNCLKPSMLEEDMRYGSPDGSNDINKMSYENLCELCLIMQKAHIAYGEASDRQKLMLHKLVFMKVSEQMLHKPFEHHDALSVRALVNDVFDVMRKRTKSSALPDVA
jgi:hypothetical protein